MYESQKYMMKNAILLIVFSAWACMSLFSVTEAFADDSAPQGMSHE
jgi:hypothetical protein